MRTKKKWSIGRYEFKYSRLTADEWMGRFGGGWQWKVGAQWCSRSLLLSLLVSELRIYRAPRDAD